MYVCIASRRGIKSEKGGIVMRTMKLGVSDLEVPVIGVGCMRINSLSK